LKILITGGMGFVGRNLASELILNGHSVELVDNFLFGSGCRELRELKGSTRELLRHAELHRRDVRSLDGRFFSRFDAVVHLAAVVGGRLTIERNPLAVAEDLEIDSKVIRYWESGNIAHLIYASSSAAYPVNLQSRSGYRLRESDIRFEGTLGLPDLTYGWSKLSGEYLVSVGKHSAPGNATVLRPFSGYGVDQDSAYPFPSLVQRVIHHDPNEDFYVWGSGQQERDFIYIPDVVRFIRGCIENIKTGTFNLCTGIPTSFITLARELLNAKGLSQVNIVGRQEMPTGVFSRVGDPFNYHAACKDLGIEEPKAISAIIKSEFSNWVAHLA
jgi:GDP-L-fucose synthase